MAQGLGWVERKWLERQRAKLERKRAKSPQWAQQGLQPISIFGCNALARCDSKTSLVGN